MFTKKKIEKQNKLKKLVAKAAIEYIKPGMTIGIGTGSTINFFIDELVRIKSKIDLLVSSSQASVRRLKSHGFGVVDLNYPEKVDIYIDSADQANKYCELIKGGGGALTREKICRVSSDQFICIIDHSKLVSELGDCSSIPVEVIPMARSYVSKELIKQVGGQVTYREGFLTDNNNIIIDINNISIDSTVELEKRINQITGVVCNGLFAVNPADLLLIANNEGRVDSLKG